MPDTIEELIEAMKLLDPEKTGLIPVKELRWAMTKLGDCLEETMVDDMVKDLESDANKDYVDIHDFATFCVTGKAVKKDKDDDGKKKKWNV